MDQKVRDLAQRLLHTGFDDLPERERRVLTRIADRVHISRNVNRAFEAEMSFGDRLADRVAVFGGSWTFIGLFAVVMVAWTMINVVLLPPARAFDPYPFIFHNLILSMIAAIQAPIIMMSQNRQSAKDRLAAAHDYEVNLKAELEILSLHEKLDDMRQRHLVEILERQERQIALLKELVDGR